MVRIAIHGGAGIMSHKAFLPEEIKAYKIALEKIVSRAFKDLQQGRSSLEVVTQSVSELENCPLFNAGRGSVLDSDGAISMDAAVMCGRTLRAGGVTDIQKLKNPVLAARWVLEHSPHALIAGRKLEDYLQDKTFAKMEPEYFITEKRKAQLDKALKAGEIKLDHWVDDSNTVGAVALDTQGNVAAATSTGGVTAKMPGRVSDSSITGAGNYANNKSCAISGTGTGDIFVQMSFCYDVHAQIVYGGIPLYSACTNSLKELAELGGIGGLIALNKGGEIVIDFNSAGMFWALQDESGPKVGIFEKI